MKGSIKGVLFENNCIFNHLFFADDILVFIEDDDYYLKNLQNALLMFEIASGLKINCTKSTISTVNVPNNRIKFVADSWKLTTKSFPVDYLGTPLGSNPCYKICWDDTINAFQSYRKLCPTSNSSFVTDIVHTMCFISHEFLNIRKKTN